MSTELKANRVIAKDSKVGKAFAKTIDSTSRQDYPLEAFDKVQGAVLAVVNDSVPTLYAGKENTPDAILNSGAASFAVGMIQQQRKDAKTGDSAYFYRALAYWPLWSLEQFQEAGPDAIAWVEKLIDKEVAHVTFRPLRNLDDSEDLTRHTGEMPITIGDLIASHSKTQINNEMLVDLWPIVYKVIEERDSQAAKFLPAPKAIANVSKALRSADWARRNTPEVEERNLWTALIAPLMFKFAASGKLVDEDGESIDHDMSVLEGWLEKRPEALIEAVTQSADKDPSALDAFLSMDMDAVEIATEEEEAEAAE